ncbi:MAG: copper resistance protein B [Gammaproteobacteria bacterium]
MKKQVTLALSCLLSSSVVMADAEDDPVLFKLMIDKLEWRAADGSNPLVWDADAWVGRDLNKLWFKTEGEYVDGTTEAASGELLYSRAISAYWDVQAGWRHDYSPEADRDWFAVSLKGLAPYWFEVDASLYAGGNGAVFARLDAEYEIMLTQRLVLSPELELHAYSQEDPVRGIGSGLTDMELGLRLRYEIRREFAPYIGVNWEQKLGSTADFAREEGESTNDIQFVLGVRAWF